MSVTIVAVVYHFFAHYRKAVVRELMRSTEFEYLFAGDERDPANSGIDVLNFEDGDPFISVRSRLFRHRYLIQSRVLGLALRKDIQTVIYLGDVQYLTTWISAALARLSGKRVLFWTHGWAHPESVWRDRVRCSFYRLAHGLLLYGHRARRIGIGKGFCPENLYVIYNSLDYEAQKGQREAVTAESIQQTRLELFASPALPMVICSCRLTREHKIDLLLEAAARLANEGCFLNIVIVGEGPELATLKAMAERFGLPVMFWGKCYDESVLATLFCAANVTVIPGNAGLTVIHSLAYGTPVITHDNFDLQGPEVEAILPGIVGDLYKYGDTADLARSIPKWITPKSSILSQRCWRMVELYYHPHTQRRLIDAAVSGRPYEPDTWEERARLVVAG